jgi:hypothetical protein
MRAVYWLVASEPASVHGIVACVGFSNLQPARKDQTREDLSLNRFERPKIRRAPSRLVLGTPDRYPKDELNLTSLAELAAIAGPSRMESDGGHGLIEPADWYDGPNGPRSVGQRTKSTGCPAIYANPS